jgi:hypothetical protein
VKVKNAADFRKQWNAAIATNPQLAGAALK